MPKVRTVLARQLGLAAGLWILLMAFFWPLAVPFMKEAWLLEPGPAMVVEYLVSGFSLAGLLAMLPGGIVAVLAGLVLSLGMGRHGAARALAPAAAMLVLPVLVVLQVPDGVPVLLDLWVFAAAWVFGYAFPVSVEAQLISRTEMPAFKLVALGCGAWSIAVALMVVAILLRGDAGWAM